MEEWDDSKKQKVREVIAHLNLPATGKALDFGCGNGVFTNIIKQVLPNWDVYGVEISATAIQNATKKNPNCHFFGIDETSQHLASFDFLFSHYVIEHVQDLQETFDTINNYLKPIAFQLHILPCGNRDSYEYNICQLHQNGIESAKGNRFFFEEPGHLRRLNTAEFSECKRTIGFELKQAYYSNQQYGAINWITKSSPRFVKKLTDTQNAKNAETKAQLALLRKQLLPLTYLQFPYSKYWALKSKRQKRPIDYIKMFTLAIPAVFSKPFYKKMEQQSGTEWNALKKEPNGSEMFLFYERN